MRGRETLMVEVPKERKTPVDFFGSQSQHFGFSPNLFLCWGEKKKKNKKKREKKKKESCRRWKRRLSPFLPFFFRLRLIFLFFFLPLPVWAFWLRLGKIFVKRQILYSDALFFHWTDQSFLAVIGFNHFSGFQVNFSDFSSDTDQIFTKNSSIQSVRGYFLIKIFNFR